MTQTDDDVNDKYSEKVATSAAWIDKGFLEEILGGGATVESHEAKAAVGVGDNYLSILYRTTVNYHDANSQQPKTAHLMIKGHPTAPLLLDMIEDMGVFKKEISIYNKCLPAMSRAIEEYFPDNTIMVAPKAYSTQRSDTVIMEDLAQAGYLMANRRDQLDFDHCVATLRTVARFHALSLKVIKDDPDILNTAATEFFCETNREKMGPFVGLCLKGLASELEKWEGCEKYAPVLQEVAEFAWEKIVDLLKPTENFNVLNHGDLWVNNIMYKYDEDGKVQAAKLVDFQLSRYTTPAVDLLYFLFTSPKPEVLASKMFDLIDIYHKALLSDIATLGMEVNFPLSQLHKDMDDRVCFGLYTICQILPIIVAPPAEVMDMDSMTLDDVNKPIEETPFIKNLRNENYKNVAGQFIKHMDKIGYLKFATEKMRPFVETLRAKQKEEEDRKTQDEE